MEKSNSLGPKLGARVFMGLFGETPMLTTMAWNVSARFKKLKIATRKVELKEKENVKLTEGRCT